MSFGFPIYKIRVPSFFALVLCYIKGPPYSAAACPEWSLLLGPERQETIAFLCALAVVLVQRGWASMAPRINSPAPRIDSPAPRSRSPWSCNKSVLQGGDCIEYFTSSPVYGAIWEHTISQLRLLFISK